MNTILLRRVISTLNTIEVKGKENCSAMLGCIEALEGVVMDEERKSSAGEKQEELNG